MVYEKSSNPFQQPPLKKGIIEQAIQNSNSMTSACNSIGCSYNTFKKWTKKYGLWDPNKSGRGISKNKPYQPLYDNVDSNSISNIREIFGVKDD